MISSAGIDRCDGYRVASGVGYVLDHGLQVLDVDHPQDATGTLDHAVFHEHADLLGHRFAMRADAARDVGMGRGRTDLGLVALDTVLPGQSQQLCVDPVIDAS